MIYNNFCNFVLDLHRLKKPKKLIKSNKSFIIIKIVVNSFKFINNDIRKNFFFEI